MADEIKKQIINSSRERGANTKIGSGTVTRKVAVGKDGKEFASAGRYTSMNKSGEITDDVDFRNKLRAINNAARGAFGDDPGNKIAALFGGDAFGMNADIADSNNIGYYSFESPVDMLESPSSREQEIRFYRLAYDRDPIVGRAIDMHTELPLSKMEISKPKCSNDEFADYVYDYFLGFINRTKLFQRVIDAVREHWIIGEAFMFLEDDEEVEVCPEAKKALEKSKGKDKGSGSEPTKESENGQLGGTATEILDFLSPEKQASWVKKRASVIDELRKAGVGFEFAESLDDVNRLLNDGRAKFAELAKVAKVAKVISRSDIKSSMSITAAPGDAPAADTAPAPDTAPPDGGADAPMPEGDVPLGGEGAPVGDEGLGDIEGMDAGGGGGGFAPPMGGGGGGGGFAMTPGDMTGDVQNAIAMGASISAQRELMELRHYLKLLQRKKELLEELKEIREKRKEEMELFSHITNKEYEGPSRIKILPPEQITIKAEGGIGDLPSIYYKPPVKQKDTYLNDPDVSPEVKERIEQEGAVPLNQDPFTGSYVVHFARKKADYELHGRSILQRCLRTCIYREKLRQVQSTLASRNMTPKSLVIAPDIPASEVMALRAHVDEAKSDPDYTIVLNYEARWDEIGSEGRLLALDAEWNHTNSDLAIGLGLSPELLIGEGMFSGSRIQLEIMNVSYLQFRDVLTGIIEDEIFKPMAMKKGFFEKDKYGRPRWIYPKVTFSRMALRDSGDLYDMLFNLYAKGSLPVEIILEFLNIDPEDCKRKLEDSMFTVNDANFNELKSNLYSGMAEYIITKSDVVKRVIKGLTLNEVDNEAEEGPEGSGEGMS
jgi:hypothetical protein